MVDCKQRIILEERKHLAVSGVSNVDSFDNERIILNSNMGCIDIGGENMKIASLNLDEGKVVISGVINSLAYVRSKEEMSVKHKGKSVFNRLMK